MALYTEKDILVKYNKRKLCLHYDCVIHVITVFFYGKYDGNISILIFHHQDGLECREGHLDGVQQEKQYKTKIKQHSGGAQYVNNSL